MIHWNVQSGTELIQQEGWGFPSFAIQEYLLPQVNVGMAYIDEYGDTQFDGEDCVRMKGNIEYLMDSGLITRRKEINYDTFEKGVVVLSCDEIQNCLLCLHEAAERAIQMNGVLMFYGD